MSRLIFLLPLLLAVLLVACDSGITGEPDSADTTDAPLSDTTDTPPPPDAVGNLKFIGHEGAWHAVGDGTWRRSLYPVRDATGTSLYAVRTQGGNLVLADSFYFRADVNRGGQNQQAQIWHEMADSIVVQGLYMQAGRLLVFEPHTCDPARGPILGVISAGYVNVHKPPASWDHGGATWMRFVTDKAAVSGSQLLPEGDHSISSFAFADGPCTWNGTPRHISGNPYGVNELLRASANVSGERMTLEFVWRMSQHYGSRPDETERIELAYERSGEIVMAHVGTSNSERLSTTSRMVGIVHQDTLTLHGVRMGAIHDSDTDPGYKVIVKVPLKTAEGNAASAH